MAEELAGFKHRFVAGSGQEGATLLLLHGTGGNENDLLPLGRELLPGANLLSPRGKVLEHGMPRFFRRLAEGVFDEEDLKFRTKEPRRLRRGTFQEVPARAEQALRGGFLQRCQHRREPAGVAPRSPARCGLA